MSATKYVHVLFFALSKTKTLSLFMHLSTVYRSHSTVCAQNNKSRIQCDQTILAHLSKNYNAIDFLDTDSQSKDTFVAMANKKKTGQWGVRFSSVSSLEQPSKTEEIDKVYLQIEGMTCASCVASIERSLMKKRGKGKCIQSSLNARYFSKDSWILCLYYSTCVSFYYIRAREHPKYASVLHSSSCARTKSIEMAPKLQKTKEQNQLWNNKPL